MKEGFRRYHSHPNPIWRLQGCLEVPGQVEQQSGVQDLDANRPEFQASCISSLAGTSSASSSGAAKGLPGGGVPCTEVQEPVLVRMLKDNRRPRPNRALGAKGQRADCSREALLIPLGSDAGGQVAE